MGKGETAQVRSVEEVAQRHEFGRRLSATPLSEGVSYLQAFFLVAVAAGGVVVLVSQGLPETGEEIAFAAIVALVSFPAAGFAISILRDGIAARARNVYTYETGLVVETKAGPLPLPYADLLVCREQIDHKRGSDTAYSEVYWKVERRDGTVCDILSVGRRLSSASLPGLCEAVLAKACEVQAGPQAAALASGETLTYGAFSFDCHRLRVSKLDLAWNQVQAVTVHNGLVSVILAPGKIPGRWADAFRPTTVGKIPNFPLFWTLFQHAFATSRPGISAGSAPGPGGTPTSPISPTKRVRRPGSSGRSHYDPKERIVLECPRDCPVLAQYAETIDKLHADITDTESSRQQNDAATTQDRASTRQLARLPSTPDVVKARSQMQNAVAQREEARARIINTLNILHKTVDSNQRTSDVIFSNCPSEPRYIDDPAKPGSMIVACASPAVAY